MTVHDRGTMKWTSLMLPEHVEALREVFTEYEAKPIIDTQKQIEIDQHLKQSLQHQTDIMLTYYQQGKYHTLYSYLLRIDQHQGYIVLASNEGEKIPLHQVTDVEML